MQLAFYFVDYVDNMREFSTLFLISIAVRKTLVGGLIRVFSSVFSHNILYLYLYTYLTLPMKYFVSCFSGTYKLGLRQYVSIIYRVLEGPVCIRFNGHELGQILGDGEKQ